MKRKMLRVLYCLAPLAAAALIGCQATKPAEEKPAGAKPAPEMAKPAPEAAKPAAEAAKPAAEAAKPAAEAAKPAAAPAKLEGIGVTVDDPKTIVPTPEYPVPNVFEVTGKKRFFVSYRYFIRNWAMLGLWSFDRTAYDTEACQGHTAIEPVPNEAGLQPKIGAEVDGRKWLVYSVPGAAERHYVDLTQFYKTIPSHVFCYAAANIYCPDEVPNAILFFGCADSARVYLNGKLVHTYDVKRRPVEPDTDKVESLTLVKGWNLLLVKVGNIMHGAGMYARFADAEGNPINVEAPDITDIVEYTPPAVVAEKGKEAGTLDLAAQQWKVKADPGAVGRKENWEKADLDEADWKDIKVPGPWETVIGLNVKGEIGYYDFIGQWFPSSAGLYNGIGWYRCKVTVPEDWKGKTVFLELGAVSDFDWTYMNGKVVGTTDWAQHQQQGSWAQAKRRYKLCDGSVQFGKENVIAVQVWNLDGAGGIMGPVVRLVAEEL